MTKSFRGLSSFYHPPPIEPWGVKMLDMFLKSCVPCLSSGLAPKHGRRSSERFRWAQEPTSLSAAVLFSQRSSSTALLWHTYLSVLSGFGQRGVRDIRVGLALVAPRSQTSFPRTHLPGQHLFQGPSCFLLFLTGSWPTDPPLTQLLFFGSLAALWQDLRKRGCELCPFQQRHCSMGGSWRPSAGAGNERLSGTCLPRTRKQRESIVITRTFIFLNLELKALKLPTLSP